MSDDCATKIITLILHTILKVVSTLVVLKRNFLFPIKIDNKNYTINITNLHQKITIIYIYIYAKLYYKYISGFICSYTQTKFITETSIVHVGFLVLLATTIYVITKLNEWR